MKHLIWVGLSLAFAQAAAAQDRDGAYMGASAGSFSYEEVDEFDDSVLEDTALAYRILGGYRFNDHFALEGGWGKTESLAESFTDFIPPFGNITLNIGAEWEILTVRALAFAPFGKFSLMGGLGYYDADVEVTASAFGVSGSDTASQDGATLVGGFEFNLERIDIRTELEWFDVDESSEAWDVSIGVLFHF